MYLEPRIESLLLMLTAYFAALSLMAGNYTLFMVILSLACLAKFRQPDVVETIWFSFLGAFLAFLPIYLLANNYSSLLPSLGTYTLAGILLFSLIITAIILAATTHFPGMRKDMHVLTETLLLAVAACLVGDLAYFFGYTNILALAGYSMVLMELLSLTVDLYRWAKLRELFEKILKE
ncbi:MAG: hypothetical protein GXO42_02700 [bacterium]|nr:hypothetical protein [bacterium]